MIITEDNYNEALNEIDKLWDAEANTPELDRLNLVFDAVYEYEEEQYPIEPPSLLGMLEYMIDSKCIKHWPKELWLIIRYKLEQYIKCFSI